MGWGRVVGAVVCTVKEPSLIGVPLLLLEPLNQSFATAGRPFVAADAIGAERGQIVIYETAREAAGAFAHRPPVDAAIIGIVDQTVRS